MDFLDLLLRLGKLVGTDDWDGSVFVAREEAARDRVEAIAILALLGRLDKGAAALKSTEFVLAFISRKQTVHLLSS